MAEAVLPVGVKALLDGCSDEQLAEVVKALRDLKRRQLCARAKKAREMRHDHSKLIGPDRRVEH